MRDQVDGLHVPGSSWASARLWEVLGPLGWGPGPGGVGSRLWLACTGALGVGFSSSAWGLSTVGSPRESKRSEVAPRAAGAWLPLAFVPRAPVQHPLSPALSWVQRREGWAFQKQTDRTSQWDLLLSVARPGAHWLLPRPTPGSHICARCAEAWRHRHSLGLAPRQAHAEPLWGLSAGPPGVAPHATSEFRVSDLGGTNPNPVPHSGATRLPALPPPPGTRLGSWTSRTCSEVPKELSARPGGAFGASLSQ